MSDRRRVLFVAEAATLAHVTRPLVLARSLDPQDYEVHFACADRFGFVFGDEPFVRHTIQSISSERFCRSLARGSPLFDYRTLAAYAEEEQGLLERLRPDVVIGDFRLSLAVSSRLAGIPYASINNAHWSPYARGAYPLPDLPMVPILGVTLSNLIFQQVQPLAFAYHARPLNRLRREKGLAPFDNVCDSYTHADYTLYADVPELVPIFDPAPHHHYLGPILWSPQTARPDWWEALPADRPCIYVTFGSSGRVGLLSCILKVLERLPVNVVIATAGRVRPGPLAANMWVADFLPGEEAAARSALVICNAGSGTAYQALNQGVPVLGLPTNMDQYLTMRYVEEAGAGIGLRSDRAGEGAIRTAIETLLADESYRQSAAAVAAAFRRFNAVERFGELLAGWPG